MTTIFKPDYQNYEGVRPINIYGLRLFFALMFVMVGYSSWTHIVTHKGDWEPIHAVTWCVWATYSALGLFGIYNTLKMLPVMVFMVFYKGLWLLVVAYPLWKTNTLKGSSAEELASVFIWSFIPLLFIPWGYVFKTYVLGRRK